MNASNVAVAAAQTQSVEVEYMEKSTFFICFSDFIQTLVNDNKGWTTFKEGIEIKYLSLCGTTLQILKESTTGRLAMNFASEGKARFTSIMDGAVALWDWIKEVALKVWEYLKEKAVLLKEWYVEWSGKNKVDQVVSELTAA